MSAIQVNFILLIGFVAFVQPALYHSIMDEIPGKEGHCLLPDSDTLIPIGTTFKSTEQCIAAVCSDNGGEPRQLHLEVMSCGVASVAPPCKFVPPPKNAVYPDCCYQVECDTSEENTISRTD